MALDTKDWKILYELDKNARRSDAAIGKAVGLSREVVAYRIKKLVKLKIIKNFMTLLNTPAIGMQNFRVHFKFNSLTKEREKEILEELMKGCFWLVKVRGPWDFNTIYQTRNYYKFKKFMDGFKLKYGTYLEDHHVDVFTKMFHFRRSYLSTRSNTENEKFETWGSVDKKINLDNMDYKILKAIENNARMSSLKIAKACKTTERIVRYRIKKMIDKKIIIGFRSFLDINKIGYIYVKVQFKLQNMQEKDYKKLFHYLKLHKNVVYLCESIGGPDYECELHIRNTGKLYEFIDKTRDLFENNIVSWAWMEYIEEVKLSYLYEV